MRKQYHFRPSERGLLAWDVDRLVYLSSHLPRTQVALDTIRELDEPFWFDGESDSPTCRAIAEHARLIETADLNYPIILSSDGRVMDGMHRVAKALLLGRESIEAVRFTDVLEPDYIGIQPEGLLYEESAQK